MSISPVKSHSTSLSRLRTVTFFVCSGSETCLDWQWLQPLSYQEICQEARDREGRSDAMSSLGIACRGSSGELFGLARTQGRKLVSSGKMARVQSEPQSRASCRQQKPLQLVSTQSDLLLGLGDLKHLRRESPGVSPCALPLWEAVTFS